MADDLLAWMRFQSTTRDLTAQPELLEISYILTDMRMQEMGTFTVSVLENKNHVEFLRMACTDELVRAYDENGIWKEVSSFGMPLNNAERYIYKDIADRLKEYEINYARIHLAGHGVSAFEYPFIQQYLPELASILEAPVYDVEGFFNISQVFLPGRLAAYEPPEFIHRANDDLISIMEGVRGMVTLLS